MGAGERVCPSRRFYSSLPELSVNIFWLLTISVYSINLATEFLVISTKTQEVRVASSPRRSTLQLPPLRLRSNSTVFQPALYILNGFFPPDIKRLVRRVSHVRSQPARTRREREKQESGLRLEGSRDSFILPAQRKHRLLESKRKRRRTHVTLSSPSKGFRSTKGSVSKTSRAAP